MVSILIDLFGYKKSTEIIYKIRMRKRLDLSNPNGFNEKIQWLKLFWQKKIIVTAADKYLVREYVENCGLSNILNELYQVCDYSNEIDWEKLPEKFVIKTTNSCGTNLIVKDVENMPSKKYVDKQISLWLKTDYGKQHLEPHYSFIQPRIIIEKYISNNNDNLQDYKFFCFNGKPYFVLIIDERYIKNGSKKRGYYSMEWEYLDIMDIPVADQLTNAKKPSKFCEMIEITKILSKDFPFVRVDLYQVEEQIIFGELTFTPHGGMANYYSEGIDAKIGGLLTLPNEKYIGFAE